MPRSNNTQQKLHIRKGDLVRVIAGNDKGKEGKVLIVYPGKQRIIVEGVNLRVHHQRPNQQFPNGGRIEQEQTIHLSNVQPLDSKGTPTRVGRKLIEDPQTGRKQWVRYARTSGEELAH